MKYRHIVASTFCFFLAHAALADTSGLVKLPSNSSGLVEIPIQGTNNAHWFLLNDCVLDASGTASPGQKIDYRPEKYGDIFFLQQHAGDYSLFAEQLLYLRIIDNTYGCKQKEEFKASLPNPLSSHKVASTLIDVYSEIKAKESTANFGAIANRLRKSGSQCPTRLPASEAEIDDLANCLDLPRIRAEVLSAADKLETYPTPSLIQGGSSIAYSRKKEFSTFTVKTSLAFAPSEHTALTTAYISVYPAAEFISSERYAWLDRISLDMGVVEPVGGTATEGFAEADNHYMFGIGFDLSENFSIHAADVLAFSEGQTNHDFAFGVSLDLLSLLSKLNK